MKVQISYFLFGLPLSCACGACNPLLPKPGFAKDMGKMAGELKDVPKEFQVRPARHATPLVGHVPVVSGRVVCGTIVVPHSELSRTIPQILPRGLDSAVPRDWVCATLRSVGTPRPA